MSRTVYVNGRYLQEAQAQVSVFDRGFLFADAVYEVTSVVNRRLIDFDRHYQRLCRSLEALDIVAPVDRNELLDIHRRLVTRNDIDLGLVYLQISRGAADRDFAYPPSDTTPTVVVFTQARPGLLDNPLAESGLRVVSVDDLRWARRDIKTVQLLYPSMAKMKARQAGKDDAWLVQNGLVTEGTSNNAFIVRGNTLVTRHLDNDILHGITRAAVLSLCAEAGIAIEERPFSIREAQSADEAFITSATTFVLPVVEIDDAQIGAGKPGPVSQRLRAIYLEQALNKSL